MQRSRVASSDTHAPVRPVAESVGVLSFHAGLFSHESHRNTRMQVPPDDAVLQWLILKRYGPDGLKEYQQNGEKSFVRNRNTFGETHCRVSSLEQYGSSLQGACNIILSAMGQKECTLMDKKLAATLRVFDEEEDEDDMSAESFNPIDDFPRMWHALQEMPWSDLMKLMVWTMLLIQFSMLGRASCVTTYCPVLEHIELPGRDGDKKLWCVDGLPHVIYLFLTGSKGLKFNQKYCMKVWRNLLGPKLGPNCIVDPVSFLLKWISTLHSKGITTGPIFPRLYHGQLQGGKLMQPQQWSTLSKLLFTKVRPLASSPPHARLGCTALVQTRQRGFAGEIVHPKRARQARARHHEPQRAQDGGRVGGSVRSNHHRDCSHRPMAVLCNRGALPQTRQGRWGGEEAKQCRRIGPDQRVLDLSPDAQRHAEWPISMEEKKAQLELSKSERVLTTGGPPVAGPAGRAGSRRPAHRRGTQ